MRSCRVLRAYAWQCLSITTVPGLDSIILRHNGIWGAAYEAVKYYYLLTYDSYVPLYNRFHRGEWITRVSGGEGALDTPGPLNGTSEASCLSISVFLWVAGRAYWRERDVEGVGKEPNHTSVRLYIYHSILSGENQRRSYHSAKSHPQPAKNHTQLD
jgi:hypothetical protein